jgi:5-methylcytosine-specific restriction endonuclease McrA
MRILYSSQRDNETLGKTIWSKGCKNIKYFSSSVQREDSDYRRYYCLSWEYECSYLNDKVVFAYGYPYNSLDLERFFKKIVYRKISIHMRMEKVKIC